MTPDTLMAQAVVYLGAAVILVPIATRLGLGSVLGYLLAGVAVGPFGLGFVAEESHTVMQFAEFGVVMMLFLVGLELDPARLWRLRAPVVGLGGLQVGLTALAILPLALLAGLPWQQGLALGLGVAMSSTAIGLQSLQEKGLMRTQAGQTSFSVLLFQDIAVIPIMAALPLLATLEIAHHGGGGGGHGGGSAIDGLAPLPRALVTLGAVVAVVLLGRIAAGPIFRVVARTGIREMFTAAALLLVIGIDLLMTVVGLSAALGTFLAGVVLANSEYRHALEVDVEPFKGLLLGLFFIAVGASIDFGLLAESPAGIAGLVVAVVAVKIGVLGVVAKVGRLSTDMALIFAIGLSQVGEFAFVLFAWAGQGGVLPESVVAPMTAVTAFSMAITPLLLTGLERWVLPRIGTTEAPAREADAIDEHNPVIIAGFGRFGQIAGRLLRSHGIGVTILDVDSDQVEMLRKYGQKVFYGDASRPELLHAAGAAEAKVLLVAVDDPDKIAEIVSTARHHFPNLAIMARARGRTDAYERLEEGIELVYRETFDTAVRAGVDAMRLLGTPGHAAFRAGRLFRQQDEATMRALMAHRHEGAAFVSRVRQAQADLSTVMQTDMAGGDHEDHGWDSEAIRHSVTGR